MRGFWNGFFSELGFVLRALLSIEGEELGRAVAVIIAFGMIGLIFAGVLAAIVFSIDTLT